MTIKEFLIKIVSITSDINDKSIGGFISLIFTVFFGFLNFLEPMGIMAGLTAAFFGLSSIDYKSALKSEVVQKPE